MNKDQVVEINRLSGFKNFVRKKQQWALRIKNIHLFWAIWQQDRCERTLTTARAIKIILNSLKKI